MTIGRERVSYHTAAARVLGTLPLSEVTEFECPDLPVGVSQGCGDASHTKPLSRYKYNLKSPYAISTPSFDLLRCLMRAYRGRDVHYAEVYSKIKSQYNHLRVSPLNTNAIYKHPTFTEGAMPDKLQDNCHPLKKQWMAVTVTAAERQTLGTSNRPRCGYSLKQFIQEISKV